jgi:hypothetical protein
MRIIFVIIIYTHVIVIQFIVSSLQFLARLPEAQATGGLKKKLASQLGRG